MRILASVAGAEIRSAEERMRQEENARGENILSYLARHFSRARAPKNSRASSHSTQL